MPTGLAPTEARIRRSRVSGSELSWPQDSALSNDWMRGLDGAAAGPANVRREFWELRLIELVPAPIQGSHHRLRQGTAIALEMLERDLGVIPTVIQVERGQTPKPDPKIRR